MINMDIMNKRTTENRKNKMRWRQRLLTVLVSCAVMFTMTAGTVAEAHAEAASMAAVNASAVKASAWSGLKGKISGTWMTSGKEVTNIRDIAGFKLNTFDTLQGGCTDGKGYAYFAFSRRSDDKVRIVKLKMTADPKNPKNVKYKLVKTSKVLTGIRHGNDMAYISDPSGKRKDMILINTARTDEIHPCYIGFIDPATLSEKGGGVFRYWSDLSKCDTRAYPSDTKVADKKRKTMEDLVADHHGYSNLAYSPERDLIIAELKTDRDFVILKPEWNSDGTLRKVTLLRYIRQNKINATSQGIDCDKDYIYTGWSALSGVLDKNIIQVYDWEGRHIGSRDVTYAYELENIFHTGKGASAVFQANFGAKYYEKYTVKKKVRVKWKKVRKKVNGKWKKVWKYKKKKRKVTQYRLTRDAFSMYLGKIRN